MKIRYYEEALNEMLEGIDSIENIHDLFCIFGIRFDPYIDISRITWITVKYNRISDMKLRRKPAMFPI